MTDFLKRIFGQNWKTTLAGIAVLIAVGSKCVLGGGNVIDCLTDAWNIAFAAGGLGLLAAKDGTAK